MIRKISAALSFLLFVCVVVPMDNHFFGQILNPNPAFAQDGLVLEDFSLYSQKGIKLDSIAESRGNVGSNGSIDIKKGAGGSVIGTFQALGDIKNEADIEIYGDVIARAIEDKGALSISGQKIERDDLVALSLPTQLFSSAGPNLEVPETSSMAIAPGSYGGLKVKKGATLNLSSGAYYFVKFEIDESASLNLDVGAGAIQINVVDKIKFDKNVDMQIIGGHSAKVLYNYRGSDKVKVEDHAVLRGILTAPSAEVEFKKGSRLEGAAYAEGIHLEKGASFSHYAAGKNGRPPTADAGGYQTALAGGQVELNGSGSSDPDGDAITYHWSFVSFPDGSSPALSDPSDPMPTFTADRVGVYVIELFVYDGTHTSLRDTATVTAVSEVLDVTDFVLYADDKIKMNEISGGVGHVGANQQILIEKGPSGTLAGDLRVLHHIKIDGEISIAGDVITNSPIENHGVFTVKGVKIENAALAPRMLPSLSFSAEGPDLKVPESASQTLVPGSYGRVEVKKGATLQFTAGSYFLRELQADDSASLVFDASGGGIVLNIAGKLGVGKDANLQIAGGSTRDVLINYAGKKVVKIEDRCVFRGTLVAPKARVEFEKDGRVEGAVYAAKIYLDRGVSFHFHAPSAANNPPAAASQNIATAEDTPAAIALSGSDPDGNSLTFDVVSQPEHGTLAGTAPNLTYMPDSDYNGSDSFTFKVNDGQADSQTGTISIRINPVNDAPVAAADNVTTQEDSAISAVSVLANDTDVDGDTLLVVDFGPTSHGTVADNGDGTCSYMPDADFHGTDIFTYTISDGRGGTAQANVTVTVNPVNDAPKAVDDALTTEEDAAITVAILANDTDVDGDSLIITNVSQGSSGTVSINPDGTITYTPSTDFNGLDSFTYIVEDGNGGNDSATVNIIVSPVNDPPVAAVQSVTLDEDTSWAIMLMGSDVEADALTYTVVSAPAHGALEGDAPNLTYTPDLNFSGTDTFSFKVNDGQVDSQTAAVSITINPINDAPVALADNVTTDEDTAISAVIVLANDTDVDGDTVLVNGFGPASHGTVANNGNGTCSYTPDADFHGTDTFTYTISDGRGGTAQANVTVTVNPVNDAPKAVDDALTTEEDAAVTVAVLANDTDVDHDSLIITNVSQDSNGTVTINPDGTITYSPNNDFNGSDSFTYIVDDGNGGGDTATVSITVSPVNDVPVANAQSISLNEDEPKPLLLSGIDVEEDSLSYEIVEQPSNGTLSGTAPDLTYTPHENYNGIDAFSFKVNDGTADSNPATVNITIAAVNDPPVASAGADQTVFVGDTVSLNGSGSRDVDGEPLSFHWTFLSAPAGSIAALSSPSIVDPGFVPDVAGIYEVQLIVNDGTVDSASDSVMITADLRMVVVPDVVGQIQADAESAIIGADLTVSAIEPAYSGTVPSGYVIRQEPAAGASIVKGSAVNLIVSAGPEPNTPAAYISASPATIQQGESALLSWSSVNVQSAHIDQGIGVVAVADSIEVFPEHTTTYSLTVTGSVGSASAQVTVTVTGTPAPQPVGSFGKQYEDLVPPDATIESFDPSRFSVVTGLVRDLSDLPIDDVAVTVFDKPEYGTAKTDAEGRFSLPIDGGATFTLVYQKQGFITSHRKVYVPWNDIAAEGTIQMVSEDPLSTVVVFDGNPNTVVTHRSSQITDQFGSRSAAMVFTGDNHAYAVDSQGSVIHELTTITTRATEYTTPESMPAVLPPTSAYTYCLEMSVDGVKRVKFAKPVITWVNNFLGFPVGEIVPVGFYDRDRGAWVPLDNGVVVRLLDTDSDGIVDALDATGDGHPNDLDKDGSFSDEVAGLGDPEAYRSGSTFWRVEANHFSPVDYNWPLPGQPNGATAPDPPGEPASDVQKTAGQMCSKEINSYITQRSRIFHEDIPITGTGMTLHYASNRVKGYHYELTVPASGETIPTSLKRIIVTADVAGRRFSQVLQPEPYQTAVIVWDGLDYLGRSVSGRIAVRTNVGFVYDTVYNLASRQSKRAFAQAGNAASTVPARQELVLWRPGKLEVYPAGNQSNSIAEGWTLSGHHYLSPASPSTLFKGDGTTLQNYPTIITTVAGDGFGGSWGSLGGDNGPATEAQLGRPMGLTVDAQGNLYIADSGNHRVRKVDPAGIITTIAGSGPTGLNRGAFSGDGGPATQARLNSPYDVAVDAEGNLFIADLYNHRVRKVDTFGIITTVAGSGPTGRRGGGLGGDNGPAVQARLNGPTGIALDAEGNLYIADSNNGRVRKVDPTGIITTIAGNEPWNYSGDGKPAISAGFDFPFDVAADASGNIYVVDMWAYRVRKIDAGGIITKVAGTGNAGDSGDGWRAVMADLDEPLRVAVDTAGNLYISDSYNGRVRKVDQSGIINTVAGTDSYGYSGDGGPATLAELYTPAGLAVDATGNLYISDVDYQFVRKVAPLSAFADYMADGYLLYAEEGGLGHVITGAGRHTSTIDLKTGLALFDFEYDENDDLVAIIDRFANQVDIERDVDGVPKVIVSPDGQITVLTIDADNHLRRVTHPDGSYYQFEYSLNGLMTAEIEPEGNRFEHIFNETGRLTDVLDPEGGRWSYLKTANESGEILSQEITGEGNITSYLDRTDAAGTYTSTITDPTGATTLFSQTGDGIAVYKSLPCGMELEFRYDIDSEYQFQYVKQMKQRSPSGLQMAKIRNKTYINTDSDDVPDQITESVTVNGKTTTRETSVLESETTTTSPEGRVVTMRYDPQSLLTESVSVPGLFDTAYAYDSRGRLTSTTTDTRQSTFAYDNQGFLESVTDPENHMTYFSHDPVGLITGINRPDGGFVGFAYDKNGNMTVLTNPVDVDHGFGFNAVNLNNSYQTPLSGSYSYTYDKDRRLVQTNFPSGKQIFNIYDNTRLSQVQTPEGDIDFTYLCGTKIDSINKGSEAVTYGYDGKMVTSEVLTGTLDQSLSYTYNNDFDVSSFTYAGQSQDYGYDNDGLLIAAGNFSITRNAGNGLPEAVSGGGLNLARTFNGYGEIGGQSYTVGGQDAITWSLSRDNNGRIIGKTETVGGVTANFKYSYDSMGRLSTVTKDGTLVEEYSYDLNGTRLYEINTLRGIEGRNFSYSDEDHLLTSGSASYTYDQDGFLTSKTDGNNVTSYTYSVRGELLNVRLPDGTVIEYIHDPLGRRIAKKINGAIVEKYLWQGLTRLLAVYDGADNLQMRFEYADDRTPVAMKVEGVTYYLGYDQVGSLRVIADSAGNVVKLLTYDSFGNIINDTNPLFPVPFGFAGGLYDPDTELVRFGYRDYDPDIGRWTAKDPILFVGGDTDLYGYVLNDPINLIDPLGLEFSDILPGIKKAIVEGAKGGAYAVDEGTKAGAYAVGEAGKATADIAMHGHPLAQTALGVALLSEAVPAAIVAGHTASTSTLFLTSSPAIYDLLMGPIRGNPPITVTIREAWKMIEMTEEHYFGYEKGSPCK